MGILKPRAVIGLGSNLGNRERWLLAAARALEHVPGIEPQALSSAYLTDPIGPNSDGTLWGVLELEPATVQMHMPYGTPLSEDQMNKLISGGGQ